MCLKKKNKSYSNYAMYLFVALVADRFCPLNSDLSCLGNGDLFRVSNDKICTIHSLDYDNESCK